MPDDHDPGNRFPHLKYVRVGDQIRSACYAGRCFAVKYNPEQGAYISEQPITDNKYLLVYDTKDVVSMHEIEISIEG